MSSALTGDKASTNVKETNGSYSEEVTITQKGEDWKTNVEWPKDIATTANNNVVVGGKATVTYTPANGSTAASVTVTYSAK